MFVCSVKAFQQALTRLDFTTDRLLRSQALWRPRGGHAHVTAKNMIFFPKFIKLVIPHHQSIGYSLISFHKNLSPIGQRMAKLWPKNMLINIIKRGFEVKKTQKWPYLKMRFSRHELSAT